MNVQWVGYVGSAAALVAAFGVLWAKVVHPVIRAFSRLMSLLDTLLIVLQAWPDTSASIDRTELAVQGHSAELTAMGLHLGEIRAEHKRLKRDVDDLWRYARDGAPLPAPPGLHSIPRARRKPRNDQEA